MGKPKKRRPRRFSCAPGRHSEVAKRQYAKANRIIEDRDNLLQDVAVRYASKHATPIHQIAFQQMNTDYVMLVICKQNKNCKCFSTHNDLLSCK